ncbi:MAG: glycosyltransferase family 2 protein [Terricaulis sp.]
MSVNDPSIQVSVIMANYNGAAHIAAAVESVLLQTERALELIVSDDASSDDSLALAQAAAGRDSRLVLLRSERNTGPAAARNRALTAARGAWIAVVDNDDFVDADRLKVLIDRAEADGADIAADNLVSFYDDAPQISWSHLPVQYARDPMWFDGAAYVRADNVKAGFGYLKPVFRRAALGDALHYDEALTIGEDAQLMMELLARGARLRLYPEAWYHYRKRRGSISHRQKPETLDAMIAALDRIDTRGDAAFAQALAVRKRSLRRIRDYLDLVAALKARDLRAALRTALAQPATVLMLGEPIAKRLGLAPRT